jgi:hypothetical protein
LIRIGTDPPMASAVTLMLAGEVDAWNGADRALGIPGCGFRTGAVDASLFGNLAGTPSPQRAARFSRAPA